MMFKKFRMKKSLTLLCTIIFLFLFANISLAGEAKLSWTAPSTNQDDTLSPLKDLKGFIIHYGTEPKTYTKQISLDKSITSHTISNLLDNKTYYFVVTAIDINGNESLPTDEKFKTMTPPDTDPPLITGIYAGTITPHGAYINWTTDEKANSRVEYGTDELLENTTDLEIPMLIAHRISLNGLLDVTEYFYRVISADSSGNTATSEILSFTTKNLIDTQKPTISNVTVKNITSSSAVVTWTTDESATSEIEFGLDSSFGSSIQKDKLLRTVHSLELTGLTSNTTYEFLVHSIDSSSNKSKSQTFSFKTSNRSPRIKSYDVDTVSGYIPLNVTFSIDAEDDDGHIKKFEWDFDGDNIFDEETGSRINSFYYENPGSYNTKVRITDNDGSTVTSKTLLINVILGTLKAPEIESLYCAPSKDKKKFTVTCYVDILTVSLAEETLTYEWDFDGNGTIDAITTDNPVSYTFTEEGEYLTTVKIRGTDGSISTSDTVTNVTEDVASGAEAATPNDESWDGSSGGGCFLSNLN